MELNADFSKKAIVHSTDEPWVASPLPGVDRRMLDRIGDEHATRATTIVRYKAGSSFSSHTHGGGEEFMVLDGIFSDEHGDYPAGTYVRNPVGSKHTPHSENGCIIYVKLGQMHPDDQDFVRVDSNNTSWKSGSVTGTESMHLHTYGGENIALMRCHPGTNFQPELSGNGTEILVLDGQIEDGQHSSSKGTWVRYPGTGKCDLFTKDGCTLLIKTGHLEGL
ncbi:MAG: cupin domain-containing protein [Cohaesibacteraceae bacterium]|nr:cupin domain-containing protein [Cohaesibacteraceae bacterium]